jgi:hypothetical protein
MKKFLTICSLLILASGCASVFVERHVTLIDVQNGQSCSGAFNLFAHSGWVILPDGTQLKGKIFGVTNGRATFKSSNEYATVNTPDGLIYGSSFGNENSFTPATRGEGWAILTNSNCTKIMQIHVMSNGNVTSGYGEATLNDGRKFKMIW